MSMTTANDHAVLKWLLLSALSIGALGCKAEAKIETPPPPPPAPAPPPPPPPAPQLEYITISDRIEFETDSAVLLVQSFHTLDEVVDVLNKNPHILKVEIQGHTDSTGDANENLLLSENRAKSVMAYLISKGIAAQRLTARGFGDRVPVAPNSTEEGRLKNRRVEFRIVEQGAPGPQ